MRCLHAVTALTVAAQGSASISTDGRKPLCGTVCITKPGLENCILQYSTVILRAHTHLSGDGKVSTGACPIFSNYSYL